MNKKNKIALLATLAGCLAGSGMAATSDTLINYQTGDVLLCFNEHQPGELGPRRVTQAEIRATFATGWTVDSIVAEQFAASLPGDGAHAWLALLTRI